MKTHPLIAGLLFLVSSAATLCSAGNVVSDPYEGLRSYLGTFVALVPPDTDRVPKRLETNTASVDGGLALRFDTWVVKADKRTPRNSGMYVWNSAKSEFEFLETNSDGAVFSGTAVLKGNVLAHEFVMTRRDGAVVQGRVVSTCASADMFIEETFWQIDGQWKLVSRLKWERIQRDLAVP